MSQFRIMDLGGVVESVDPEWAFNEIRDPECSRCELGPQSGELRCLVGVGPRDADLMLIGEAPGRREIQPDVRRPFAGPAGQYLDKILDNVHLSREELFITNVIACRPPHNRDPSPYEIKACKPFLDAQIAIVKPKRIMALGNIALKALTGRSGIATYRGRPFTLNSIEVLASYHPSYVRSNPRFYPLLYTDMLKFKGEELQAIERHYAPVTTMDEVIRVVKIMLAAPEVSFDLETTHLDPWTGAHIICIGLSDVEGSGYVIPLEGELAPWTNNEREKIFRWLGAILNNPRARIIAYNAKFDLMWAWTRSISARCDFDPMMASVVLDENLPHSLEANVQLYLDPNFTKPEPSKITTWSWDRIWPYNAGDSDQTLRLTHVLEPKLAQEPESHTLFRELIMPVQTKVLPNLELNGIYVHDDKLKEAEEVCVAERDKHLEAIKSHVPDGYIPPVKSKKSLKKGFNPGSPKQLGNLLFDILGLPPGPLTDTGDWSTAEAVLVDLKGKHSIIEPILEFRKYSKYESTYIIPWKEWRDPYGFIHPHYHLRPVTGRLSSDDPNLQQTPRESMLRNVLGAPPGWVLLAPDYSQIEMRIAAHESQDENLIQIFLDDLDVHLETVMLITGFTADQIDKELRKKAKAVNFGLIFGMGAAGLVEYAKEKYEVVMTLDEGIIWRKGFFTRYPRLLEWHRRQIREVHEAHQVKSFIGRIRHLNNILSADEQIRAEAERQAINSPVQGLASDLCLLSAVEVLKVLPPSEGRLCGLVHDQALYMIREDVKEHWKPIIKNIMENPPFHRFTSEKFTVPIKVDMAESPYWN